MFGLRCTPLLPRLRDNCRNAGIKCIIEEHKETVSSRHTRVGKHVNSQQLPLHGQDAFKTKQE